jgi:DNA-binding NtrC family response regulator
VAKILFVEDDNFIREAVSQTMEEWGYHVIVARDVEEALGLLASTKDIDALVTDITLGKSTEGGYELSHSAVQQFPSLHVIYTSGSVSSRDHVSRSVRDSQFIQKPYREENLRRIVDALFAVSV